MERSSLHSQAAREPSDSAGLKRVEDVKRHISKCIEMRKVGNWNAVLRESEAAILSGADSAPQVLLSTLCRKQSLQIVLLPLFVPLLKAFFMRDWVLGAWL